jgi:hypothetical protein
MLGEGTYPNKVGICSSCGKRIRYGKRWKHWANECWKNIKLQENRKGK